MLVVLLVLVWCLLTSLVFGVDSAVLFCSLVFWWFWVGLTSWLRGAISCLVIYCLLAIDLGLLCVLIICISLCRLFPFVI